MGEILKNEIYQYKLQQILNIMKQKQKNEEQKQKNEEQKQKNEELKKLIQALENMETIFKESQKKSNQNSIPQSPKMKTSPKSHQKHPNSHQKIAA
jgi:hypothetical protein